MSVHICFRNTWFYTTWIACMISCFSLNPLQKIFDYCPKVLYDMVDNVEKKSKLLYDFKLLIFTCYEVKVHFIMILMQFVVSKSIHF